MHVIDVADARTIDVAVAPPRVTVTPNKNPVPVIVTEVPPVVGPVVGEILLTVGAAWYVYPLACDPD